jgi:hypothetical protein
MAKSKMIKIKYTQVKAEPEEIQRRLDKAFNILFSETLKQKYNNKKVSNV